MSSLAAAGGREGTALPTAQEGSWGFGAAAKQSPHLEPRDSASGVRRTEAREHAADLPRTKGEVGVSCVPLHVALLLDQSGPKEPLSSGQDAALA